MAYFFDQLLLVLFTICRYKLMTIHKYYHGKLRATEHFKAHWIRFMAHWKGINLLLEERVQVINTALKVEDKDYCI